MTLLAQPFPAGALCDESGLAITLRGVPVAEFNDPFCHDTLDRIQGDPSAVLKLGFRDLVGMARKLSAYAPGGMIFHVSRCGSTLLSNALRQMNGLAVYSEPQVINDLLHPPHRLDRLQMVSALKCVGAQLASHAQGPYVLKFRSWNSLFASHLMAAFPQTPWIFLSRDPVEVGVSQIQSPSTWLRAWSHLPNPFAKYVQHLAGTQEVYIAKMFAAFCDAVAKADNGVGMSLDYSRLPESITSSVMAHFGISATTGDRRKMLDSFRFYSKSPKAHLHDFVDDSASKRLQASHELREACERHASTRLEELFAQLSPKSNAHGSHPNFRKQNRPVHQAV